MDTRSTALAIAVWAIVVFWLPAPALGACATPVAVIVSMDNAVEVREAGGGAFAPAVLNAGVCEGDTIRVGEFSRATIAFVDSGLRLTIEQNTEFSVRAPRRPGRSLIDLIRGAILFFSRQPRSLDVQTPFVNAAVEGTEFIVRVEANRAEVAVLDGTVAMENEQGRLVLTSGESGQAGPGQAPQRVDIRPQDAVRWALYYEPLLPPASLPELERVPAAQRDAGYFVRRASALLAAGRVSEARNSLEEAAARDAKNSDARALTAIIDLAENRQDPALAHAREAVSLAPGSVNAALALSYALQADFQLEAARDELLRVIPPAPGPEHALALARLAELRLSLGDVDGAVEDARRSADLAPRLARSHAVVGFAELARVRTSAAKAAFQRAIELESSNPLAHLGLGLAKIRDGDLGGGRAEIETAAALDITDPIIRSYLGKAYFEERRDGLSAQQLALAKELDPRDPTPWLYDAIRKQTVNRPVEALQDLQRSIELNDNRAVYRSRFLLETDMAARSASLAGIYRDLGFEQRALAEGFVSLAANPGDFAGHRFLADTYSALPRHEVARVSELLQALLLQPINITPVPVGQLEPSLFILEGAGPSQAAFNEFNPLFTRNRVAVQASGLIGQEDIFGDEVTVSGVWDRVSFSVGQFHYGTDGLRENNGQDRDLANAFVQVQLSHATSVQGEFRTERTSVGDLFLNFDPTDFSSDQAVRQDSNTARLGFRHAFTPHSQLIGSLYWQNQDASFSETIALDEITVHAVSTRDSEGFTGEVRHLFQAGRFKLSSGVGRFQSDRRREETQEVRLPPPLPGFTMSVQFSDDPAQTNAYVYADVDAASTVVLTVGASADFFKRESYSRNQFNPKLGLVWRPRPSTTFRAAGTRTLNRSVISSQTIEPTQVAGFSQLFADSEAEEARQVGIGVDHRLNRFVFGGAEYTRRNLRVPVETEDELGRRVDVVPRTDQFGRAYLYVAPDRRVAISVEYFVEDFDHTAFSGDAAFLKARTHRLAFGTRYFHASGLLGRLQAVHIDQSGTFLTRGFPLEGTSSFWVVDVAAGYRLPRRLGRLLFEVKNLFDETFRFQDTDPGNPRIRPGRLAVFKFIVGI